jgi:hypothetical protein
LSEHPSSVHDHFTDFKHPMSNELVAKNLLAQSYIFSAQRIRAAIEGQLPIRNSHEPNSPPAGSKEVIGLCGQSGRHPYFRIPIDDLRFALDRILGSARLPSSASSQTDRTIDEIAAACQGLRQQTYFNDGTGCVNDSLPSMVPLLPPEEIWFEGREIPLDVWRLISFEFDFVSSAVASTVAVEDFAFSAVNQNALAFRFLMSQLKDRRVQFRLEPQKIPPPWMPIFNANSKIDVNLARLYFEAGRLLTPLAKDEYTPLFAAIRYLHWIDDTLIPLRVKDAFDQDTVDSRYRGIFAEETAIGLMAVVLSEVFGANLINNTVEWIAANQPGSPKHSGPIADFIAKAINPVTGALITIIAESKGSLGSAVSATRKERAEKQLDATKTIVRGTTEKLPLTFCSSIRFTKEKTGSACEVIDPPSTPDGDAMNLDAVAGWRLAYAKALKFVGLETAARQVFRGEPSESIRSMDFDRERDRQRGERDRERIRRTGAARERFGMNLLLDVGKCALSIDPQVADVLRHGINEETQHKIAEVLRSRRQHANERHRGASFEMSLGLGCVFYSDLDEGYEKV